MKMRDNYHVDMIIRREYGDRTNTDEDEHWCVMADGDKKDERKERGSSDAFQDHDPPVVY